MTELELFELYNKDVYHTCYYMLRNAEDAEDVCHDVFVTVFRQNWRDIEHTRTWILRITMNHCLNVLRKNQTRRAKQKQIERQYDQATQAIKSVDTIVMEKTSAAEWDELLKQLPDKLLAVITLRYIGDLSIAEIAEALNIPEGTVKSRLHKALNVLRKKVKRNESYVMRGEKKFGYY